MQHQGTLKHSLLVTCKWHLFHCITEYWFLVTENHLHWLFTQQALNMLLSNVLFFPLESIALKMRNNGISWKISQLKCLISAFAMKLKDLQREEGESIGRYLTVKIFNYRVNRKRKNSSSKAPEAPTRKRKTKKVEKGESNTESGDEDEVMGGTNTS